VLSSLFVLFLGFFVVPSVTGVFEFEGFGVGGRRMQDYYIGDRVLAALDTVRREGHCRR
jgi:hypothetical protein